MVDVDVLKPGRDTGEDTEAITGGFLQSILDIFIDPMKVFKRIGVGLTWWKPFVLSCVLALVIAWLMMPFRRALLELNVAGMEEEELARALEAYDRFGVIGMISVPFVLILTMLIIAGIAHVVVALMSSNARFKKTLSLIAYANLVPVLGQLISVAVLRARGVEGIESAADIQMSFSLAAVFPESGGFLQAFLESLGVFQVWFYILLILGVAAIFKVSRTKAVFVAVPIWLLSLVVTYLMKSFGGGMG